MSECTHTWGINLNEYGVPESRVCLLCGEKQKPIIKWKLDSADAAFIENREKVDLVDAQKVQEEFDDFCIKKFGSGMSIRDRFILKKFFKQNGYKIIKEVKS